MRNKQIVESHRRAKIRRKKEHFKSLPWKQFRNMALYGVCEKNCGGSMCQHGCINAPIKSNISVFATECDHTWVRPVINAENQQCSKCGKWREGNV